MKKKFNKKKLLTFGIIGLFALALVSAVLVGYLSNMQTGTITVESPLVLTGGTFAVPASNAFNLITKDFVLENKANTEIYAIVETSITSDGLPFDETEFGEEFVTFEIGIEIPEVACTAGGGDRWESSDSYCYWDASYDRHFTGVISGVYYVQMGDGTTPILASETMNGRMRLQFNIDVAPATYTFVTQAFTVDSATDLA